MAMKLCKLSVGYGARDAFRNVALPAALVLGLPLQGLAAPVTIAALGDSLTQGYGLPPEAGFVAELGRWLEERDVQADLVNAGVSGDTTAGGLSRIDWTLADGVDGLILALGGNDVLRGIAPEVARANLDGILARAEEEEIPVLLVGITVPANYGPDYQAAFEAIYPSLAEEYGALFHPDFLGAITAGSDRASALATLMQPDGIHPNAEGVKRIVADLGPSVLALIERARKGPEAQR